MSSTHSYATASVTPAFSTRILADLKQQKYEFLRERLGFSEEKARREAERFIHLLERIH
jgi:hypothetical protein